MSIKLDHTALYAKNHEKSAYEFADVMGLRVGNISGPGYDFSAVRVNSDLSIYFMGKDNISLEQHLAFVVDGKIFDQTLHQLQDKKIAYGNSPFARDNQRIDHDFASRGLFWTNLDGCLFEVMTYDF